MFAMALLNRQCPSMFASMFARLKSLYFGTLLSALLSLVSKTLDVLPGLGFWYGLAIQRTFENELLCVCVCVCVCVCLI